MSYEIVKSIAIKDDKVFVTSASNNVYPRTFNRWEVPGFSKIYREGGLKPLLNQIAVNVWHGNFQLYRRSKLCKAILEGYDLLSAPSLRHFLDAEHASDFITDMALHVMKLGPKPDIEKLYALRSDKEAVLKICANWPEAFDYASPQIQQDREAAKAHILANGDKLLFTMPRYFRNDRELVILAIQKDGTNFRDLSPELQADKEIVRLAFNPALPRPHFEHLPDLVSKSLQSDVSFMKELVTLCPRMHVFRTPHLLEDKSFVEAWLKAGGWTPYNLHNLSGEMLRDPDLQTIIFSKVKDDPENLKKVRQHFVERGVMSKLPLDALISAAENRTQAAIGHNKDVEQQR